MKRKLTHVLFLGFVLAITASCAQAGIKKGFMIAPHLGNPAADQKDVSDLYAAGARIVRFQIFFNTDPSVNAWIHQAKQLIDFCDRTCPDMTIVIDVHHPGGTSDANMTDLDGFIRTWQRFATAFRTARPHRVWYDLLNEPREMYGTAPNKIRWRDLALRTAQEIRKIDKDHRIVVAVPGTITHRIGSFEPLPGIANQTIEVHFWNWFESVQSPVTTRYRYGQGGHTRAALEECFQTLQAYEKQFKVQVFLGEIGINREHADAVDFLRDATGFSEKYEIDTTVHAFREAAVWDYEKNPAAWRVIKAWLAR